MKPFWGIFKIFYWFCWLHLCLDSNIDQQGGVCLAFADEVLCWLYGTVKESKIPFILYFYSYLSWTLLNLLFGIADEDYILQFAAPFTRLELLQAQSCPQEITDHVQQLWVLPILKVDPFLTANVIKIQHLMHELRVSVALNLTMKKVFTQSKDFVWSICNFFLLYIIWRK